MISCHFQLFGLENVLPLDCVRLVKYDEMHDYIDQSYPRQDDCSMELILGGVKFSYIFDLLLETKTPEQTFAEYKPGGRWRFCRPEQLRWCTESRHPILTF